MKLTVPNPLDLPFATLLGIKAATGVDLLDPPSLAESSAALAWWVRAQAGEVIDYEQVLATMTPGQITYLPPASDDTDEVLAASAAGGDQADPDAARPTTAASPPA